MDNEITIDIQEILLLPDDSITDIETIRQIGLATTKWKYLDKDTAHRLGRKIKHEFGFAALYPHVMKKFDILPDRVDEETKELVNRLNKRRGLNMEKKQKEHKLHFVTGDRTPSYSRITDLLNQGWLVKDIVAQKVSGDSGLARHGGFFILLEK